MADHNQLNKATLQPLEVIFNKNKKVKEAVLLLVRTAYENHHENEKNRRIQLTKCILKKLKFLIEQLGDETFKSKLKDSIASTIKSDTGLEEAIKAQLSNDIASVLEEVSSGADGSGSSKTESARSGKKTRNKTTSKKQINVPSNKELIDKLFSNKNFVTNITKFTKSVLQKSNRERISVLTKAFAEKLPFSKDRNEKRRKSRQPSIGTVKLPFSKDRNEKRRKSRQPSIGTFGGRTELVVEKQPNSLVRKVTGGFDKLIEQFILRKGIETNKKKSLSQQISEKISEGIVGTVKYFKHMKYKTLRGIVHLKRNLNLKGVFKLFKLSVFGLVGLGIKAAKGMFSIAVNTTVAIYKMSKTVFKGLSKLTTSVLTKIKYFFLSKTGAYITGYVVGFLYTKMKKIFSPQIQWVKDKADEIGEKIHKIKHDILDYFLEDATKTHIKFLNRFVNDIPWIETDLEVNLFKLHKLAQTGASGLGRNIGATVGAAAGGIAGTIAKFVTKFFLKSPWGKGASVFAGVGTALTTLAGAYMGSTFASFPDVSELEANFLVSKIRQHYRSERGETQSNTVGQKLQSKIESVDVKIKALENRKKDLNGKQNKTDAEKVELEHVSKNLERENEKKKKLQQMQSEVQEKFRGMLGGPTYLDETDDDRKKHLEIIDKIRKAIELEDAEGISYSEKNDDRNHRDRNNSIYDSSRTDVNDLFKYAIDDKQDKIQFFKTEDTNWNSILEQKQRTLSTIKNRAVIQAIRDYQSNSIPFNTINERANVYIKTAMDAIDFDHIGQGLASARGQHGILADSAKDINAGLIDSYMNNTHNELLKKDFFYRELAKQIVDDKIAKLSPELRKVMTDQDRGYLVNSYYNFLKSNGNDFTLRPNDGKYVMEFKSEEEKKRFGDKMSEFENLVMEAMLDNDIEVNRPQAELRLESPLVDVLGLLGKANEEDELALQKIIELQNFYETNDIIDENEDKLQKAREENFEAHKKQRDLSRRLLAADLIAPVVVKEEKKDEQKVEEQANRDSGIQVIPTYGSQYLRAMQHEQEPPPWARGN